MKKTFLIFALATVTVMASAQDKVYICQGQKVTSFLLETVDSITFAKPTVLEELEQEEDVNMANLVTSVLGNPGTIGLSGDGLADETLFGRDLMWEQAGACAMVWGRTRGYWGLPTFQYIEYGIYPVIYAFNRFNLYIARMNKVIGTLTARDDRSSDTDLTLGSAYFLRAFCHFYIAYRHGCGELGAPFTMVEENPDDYETVYNQRATVMENYQLIIDDLDKAIELLPALAELPSNQKNYPQKQAAIGLKAKTYAYWATWDQTKWNDVIEQVTLLEKTYDAHLAENLSDNFTSDESKWYNPEYLFGIPPYEWTGSEQANMGGIELPGVMLENRGWGQYNGWGQFKPTLDIYEEMLKDGEGNSRLKFSILEYNDEFQYFGNTMRYFSPTDSEAGFGIRKYMEPFSHANAVENGYVSSNSNWPVAKMNFPLLRFADVLLLRAEAYLNTGKADLATKDINAVRTRSGLKEIEGTAKLADIYHERTCELAFEYADHLFDLKRWNRSTDAELKALANAELNASPRVRKYADRNNPTSTFEVGNYDGYNGPKLTYEDYMMVFPYPQAVISNSNGTVKQNPGY